MTNEITEIGNGVERAVGTVSQTVGVSGFTNATANEASVTQRISNQFTYTGSESANVIREAELFNETAGGLGVFAMKNFPSQVSLNNGDQLTVNRDIIISSTDPMGP